jgi:hypothetical protein
MIDIKKLGGKLFDIITNDSAKTASSQKTVQPDYLASLQSTGQRAKTAEAETGGLDYLATLKQPQQTVK